MSTLHALPVPIARRVLAKAQAHDVPAFVLLHDSSGREVAARFRALTPALLGGLIVKHRGQAGRAIKRFMVTGSRSSARTAAEHIYFTNLFTIRREQLLGQKVACSQLPFPVGPERGITWVPQ